jgi:hypothetical protein
VRISPDGRRVRGRLIDSDFIPEQFLPPRDAADRDTVSDVRTGVRGRIKHKVKSTAVTLRSKKGAPRKRARG